MGRSAFGRQKCSKSGRVGALLDIEIEMFKFCTWLQREGHLGFKTAYHGGSTLGRGDFQGGSEEHIRKSKIHPNSGQ